MQDNTQDKIVDIRPGQSGFRAPPVTDFWFAQLDLRLSAIERTMRRLEWQIWALVCAGASLLLIEIVRTFSPS